MKEKLPLWAKICVAVGSVFFLSGLFFYLFRFQREKLTQKPTASPVAITTPNPTTTEPSPTVTNTPDLWASTCPASCQKLIDQRVEEAVANLTSQLEALEKKLEAVTSTSTSSTSQQPTYIPLVSSAETVSTGWTDVAGSDFRFDPADYPAGATVHYEVNLRAVHGSGLVYTRLYDKTHERGVDFSEHSTNSDSFQYLASNHIAVWQGNNLYRVQIRSSNGTQVELQAAKLKVAF